VSYEKWIPVVDSLILQTYYRQLSWVSIHAPVDEVYAAAEYLASEKRGGLIYWVVAGRVFRWDGLTVFPDITQTNWFIGGARNTAMARRGWWAMYLLDVQVKRLAKVLGGGPSVSGGSRLVPASADLSVV